MPGKTDFKQLKAYFDSLNISGKKEFIRNLKEKISGVTDSRYLGFLQQCIRQYNDEVDAAKKTGHTNSPLSQLKDASPDITAEVFAKAFSRMISGEKHDTTSVNKQLLGRWQRVSETGIYYFDFKENGTFDTNETSDGEILTGNFSTGLDGVLLLEPKEELKIINVLLSQSSLLIYFSNGNSFTYTRLEF